MTNCRPSPIDEAFDNIGAAFSTLGRCLLAGLRADQQSSYALAPPARRDSRDTGGLTVIKAVHRMTRRHASTPEVFIGVHCHEPGCIASGTLHEHRPPGIGRRIVTAEKAVLAELAARTVDSDSWTAAIEQFGGAR